MTSTTTGLFSIDRAYDEDKASDGISRYGAYLHQRYDRALEDDDLDGPERWAAWCWYCATPPVMAPGFVRYRDPVISTDVYRDDWRGELAVRLIAAAPLPRIPGRWRSWRHDFAGDLEAPRESSSEGGPIALTRVEFEAILDVDLVVPDFHDRAELVAGATATVSAIAEAIERSCGDAVAALWA